MEKKNTILLTVIAIATLLVAVVGATFAYFTANVTTTGNDNNQNKASVTTYALTSATMNAGNKVQETNVYPGFKTVKYVTITGQCPNGATTCDSVDAEIVITPTIAAEFGNDVTWSLYEGTNSDTDQIVCNGTTSTENGQSTSTFSCPNTEGLEAVIENGSTTAKSYPVTVTGGFAKTYYLVVEYAETNAPQNTQQGKELSLEMKFQLANS